MAWALPVELGVDAKPIEDEAVRQVQARSRQRAPVAYKGQVGAARPASTSCATRARKRLLAARVRLAGFKVEAAEKPFSAGGKDYPAGSWVVSGQAGLRSALENVAAELGARRGRRRRARPT